MTEAPRTLVLLRHGRTAWNHEGRMQGQSDVALDELGLAQAAAAAAAIASLAPTSLWSSDLDRARMTAAAVGKACGLDVVLDARLRELSFGETEGLHRSELAERSPEGYAALLRADYDHVPGAEPLLEVRARMTAALADLLAATAPGETSVAVSHGAAIRVAVGALLGWPEEQFRTLGTLGNCGWVVLTAARVEAPMRLAAYNRSADGVA